MCLSFHVHGVCLLLQVWQRELGSIWCKKVLLRKKFDQLHDALVLISRDEVAMSFQDLVVSF